MLTRFIGSLAGMILVLAASSAFAGIAEELAEQKSRIDVLLKEGDELLKQRRSFEALVKYEQAREMMAPTGSVYRFLEARRVWNPFTNKQDEYTRIFDAQGVIARLEPQ